MPPLPATSRAAVLRGHREAFSVEEVPLPREIEPGAILVKMDVATLCGSDVHSWQGDGGGHTEFPLILGHEMTGRVHAAGSGVEADSLGQPLAQGDRIVWTHASCGQCYHCTVSHEETLCPNRVHTLTHPITKFPYVLGTLAEYCYVPPTAGRVKVPDEVPSEESSAASCAFRTVVHGFDRLGTPGPYDSVVIQGAGPLGLFSLALAIQAGVSKAVVIGAPAQRLEVARSWGASHTIDIEEMPDAAARAAYVRELTDGQGPNVVIEVSGGTTAFSEGIDMVRRGGRYLVIGQIGAQTVELEPRVIVTKQLDIIGVFSGSTEHYYKALQFLKLHRARFPFSEMMTSRYPLERINDAIESMRRFADVKAVVQFD